MKLTSTNNKYLQMQETRTRREINSIRLKREAIDPFSSIAGVLLLLFIDLLMRQRTGKNEAQIFCFYSPIDCAPFHVPKNKRLRIYKSVSAEGKKTWTRCDGGVLQLRHDELSEPGGGQLKGCLLLSPDSPCPLLFSLIQHSSFLYIFSIAARILLLILVVCCVFFCSIRKSEKGEARKRNKKNTELLMKIPEASWKRIRLIHIFILCDFFWPFAPFSSLFTRPRCVGTIGILVWSSVRNASIVKSLRISDGESRCTIDCAPSIERNSSEATTVEWNMFGEAEKKCISCCDL